MSWSQWDLPLFATWWSFLSEFPCFPWAFKLLICLDFLLLVISAASGLEMRSRLLSDRQGCNKPHLFKGLKTGDSFPKLLGYPWPESCCWRSAHFSCCLSCDKENTIVHTYLPLNLLAEKEVEAFGSSESPSPACCFPGKFFITEVMSAWVELTNTLPLLTSQHCRVAFSLTLGFSTVSSRQCLFFCEN